MPVSNQAKGSDGLGAAGQGCTRCLYDASIPGIEFGTNGQCSYCRLHDEMDLQYPVGKDGEVALQQMVAEMKEA